MAAESADALLATSALLAEIPLMEAAFAAELADWKEIRFYSMKCLLYNCKLNNSTLRSDTW